MNLRLSVTKEQQLAGVLAIITMIYAIKSSKELKIKRDLQIIHDRNIGNPQRVPSFEKIQDHPLVTWMIPNMSALFLISLRNWIIGHTKSADSNLKIFLKVWLGNIIVLEGAMSIHYFLINKVYQHIPFFSKDRKKQTFREIFIDYLQANTVVNILSAILQVIVVRSNPKAFVTHERMSQIRPLRFLLRYFYLRVFTDVGFYIGHYILHVRKVYWLHKWHHDHNKTQLTTNFHFHWFDLLVEAFLPFYFGVTLYENIITSISENEINLMGLFVFWFEMQSHAGKALPTMSSIPPLGPIFQKFDDWNCWFHEIHHNLQKCNYSISPWMDSLTGTARWDYKKKHEEE